LRNRESFDFLKCSYNVVIGTAANLKDSLAGKISKEALMDGIWVLNGDKVRLEFTLSKKLEFKGGIENQPFSQRTLSNGSFSLGLSGNVNMGNVFFPENPGHGLIDTPFDCGMMGFNEEFSPGRCIKYCLREGRPCTFEAYQEEQGRKLAVVRMLLTDETEKRVYFDTRRGFLPVKVVSKEPSWEHTVVITNAKDCGGRWFPLRTVVFQAPKKSEKAVPSDVRIYEVVGIDADNVPSDDDFFLEVEAGRVITEDTTPGAQFGLQESTHVGLGDIEKLFHQCRMKAGIVPPTSWFRRTVVPLVVVALLVLMVGISIARRRGLFAARKKQ